MTLNTTSASVDTSVDPDTVGGDVARFSGPATLTRFLGLPLFWKIVLANLVLVAVAALVSARVAADATQVSSGELTAMTVGAVVTVIFASVVVNAVLIRLALSPLEALERTAGRVARGAFDARVPASPLADRRLRRTTAVFNDMLDSLSASRIRRLELARRVLQSEERERQRIAHELYSGTAQTLAGVLVRLRITERHPSGDADGAIVEIREGVVSALEEIRGIARRLRPPELDELGVRAALEAHARSLVEGRPIEIRFEGDIPPMSRESELALFRIIQEGLRNAVMHAGADSVSVTFTREGESVVAEIVDDGQGFDLGEALIHTEKSLGISGMRERAGYVHGELSLESDAHRGTRLRVVIPPRPRPELQEEFGAGTTRVA